MLEHSDREQMSNWNNAKQAACLRSGLLQAELMWSAGTGQQQCAHLCRCFTTSAVGLRATALRSLARRGCKDLVADGLANHFGGLAGDLAEFAHTVGAKRKYNVCQPSYVAKKGIAVSLDEAPIALQGYNSSPIYSWRPPAGFFEAWAKPNGRSKRSWVDQMRGISCEMD